MLLVFVAVHLVSKPLGHCIQEGEEEPPGLKKSKSQVWAKEEPALSCAPVKPCPGIATAEKWSIEQVRHQPAALVSGTKL
jgi:hypothetical protein